MAAKPRWSRLRRRKPGGRAVKDSVLTWGDLASRLKGRRGHEVNAEREVSRGRSSDVEAEQGRPRTSEASDGAKDRTARRVQRT